MNSLTRQGAPCNAFLNPVQSRQPLQRASDEDPKLAIQIPPVTQGSKINPLKVQA